jgi:hypothetical protein
MKSLNSQLRAFKTSVFDRADEETARALIQAEAEYRADVPRHIRARRVIAPRILR